MYELESSHFPFGHASSLYPYDIRFDPTDAACLQRQADGSLVFRALAPAELTSATLLIVDDDNRAVGHDFALVGRAGGVAFWQLRVDASDAPFRYGLVFRLASGTPVYWSPTGITNGFERLDHFRVDPSELRVHDVPEWATGRTIYQIFPDRFANGDPTIDPSGVVPWGSPAHGRQFQGGDLAGVEAHIDHLEDLGIGAVYLNPIFASPSTHRYDTVDYRSVDPSLGGDDALRSLVDALHERDIKVILDVSLNHCHPTFFAFADLLAHGRDSAYADWFDVHEWPLHVRHRPHLAEPGSWTDRMSEWFTDETGIPLRPVDGNGPVFEPAYDAWYGVPTMPRLDLANPDTRAYMLEAAAYWVREFDIDGWRMDVARYVDHDFWPEFRASARRERSDVYLLAEIMGDTGAWLQGDGFDATMNYTFRQLCLDHFAAREIDGDRFRAGYLRMLAMYSPTVTAASHNLVGSHDTARFRTVAGGRREALELATLFQMTTPGAPGLYYGDEIGMEGDNDPFCRGPMDWDAATTDPLMEGRRALAATRAKLPALRSAEIRLLEGTGEATVFLRGPDESVLVALNAGDEPVRIADPAIAGFGQVVHAVGGDATCENGSLALSPWTGAVLT